MLRKFFAETGISIKDFGIILVLLVNVFTWFYMTPLVVSGILVEMGRIPIAQEVLIWSTFYGSIVISSIIGAVIAKKVNRLKFIYAWIAIGTITSILPILFSSFTWIDLLVISILLGTSFGLGIPSCLSYFGDITQVENRGRISGIVLLAAYMTTAILAIPIRGLETPINLIIFAGWRSLGLIVLFLHPNEKIISSKRKMDGSFSELFKDRTFGFYILAWIMFCLVDRMVSPVVLSIDDIADYHSIITPILVSITSVIAGILADRIGRKKIILTGFISLGIAYALVGITQGDPLAGYFFLVINGISAGLLFVTFFLTLWGDISQSGFREKYYAIGILPLHLTYILGLNLEGYILGIKSIFSVAAFFLFIAVLPLLYAPETLPEKNIEIRKLRRFADNAKKMKEKYEKTI
jgi:MFS family permease